VKTEERIKEQIELFKKRQQNARIAGNHNGYFEIGMAIQALEWVLEE
jgi:hypothetical protein